MSLPWRLLLPERSRKSVFPLRSGQVHWLQLLNGNSALANANPALGELRKKEEESNVNSRALMREAAAYPFAAQPHNERHKRLHVPVRLLHPQLPK